MDLGGVRYDPVPFYGYAIYYGASINGRQAWVYNNAAAAQLWAEKQMEESARGVVNTVYINYRVDLTDEEKTAFESGIGNAIKWEGKEHAIKTVGENPGNLGPGEVYLEVWDKGTCQGDTTGIGEILMDKRGWYDKATKVCYVNWSVISGDVFSQMYSESAGRTSYDALHFYKMLTGSVTQTGDFAQDIGKCGAWYALHEIGHYATGKGDNATGYWPYLLYPVEPGEATRYVNNPGSIRGQYPAGTKSFFKFWYP